MKVPPLALQSITIIGRSADLEIKLQSTENHEMYTPRFRAATTQDAISSLSLPDFREVLSSRFGEFFLPFARKLTEQRIRVCAGQTDESIT